MNAKRKGRKKCQKQLGLVIWTLLCIKAQHTVHGKHCTSIDLQKRGGAQECTEIDLSAGSFLPASASFLLFALERGELPNLRELYLWDNDIDAADMKRLAHALHGHEAIRALYLQNNRIGTLQHHNASSLHVLLAITTALAPGRCAAIVCMNNRA